MRKNWSLTQESFDRLLGWLGDGRDEAGRSYESIRRSLIKIFTCRGCREPEELADETINRVVEKLPDIEATYTGERALYFYGVANNVHLEYLRRKPAPAPPPPRPEPSADDDDEGEREYECLLRCIGVLTPASRELVLQYYEEEKGAKVSNRRRMAERLGIALNALRIRAHRIRLSLQKCVEQCVAEQQAAG
jgi:DNA-directed RNA polymerase specialized sigma24 family protein